MKTYLVSEELLRQVLEGLQYGAMRIPTGATGYAEAYGAIEALRTLLAKEPSEQVAWCRLYADGTLDWLQRVEDKQCPTPLYRKDTP